MKKGREILQRIGIDLWTFKWMLLAFLIYDVLIHLITGAFCPMVIVTGLPCPGCGMTRAALYFMKGQFSRGMQSNPAILLWILFAAYVFIQRYIRGKKPAGVQYLSGAIAAVMIVVYVYRMITVFPDRPPMSVTYRNLLSDLIPGYREFLRRI